MRTHAHSLTSQQTNVQQVPEVWFPRAVVSEGAEIVVRTLVPGVVNTVVGQLHLSYATVDPVGDGLFGRLPVYPLDPDDNFVVALENRAPMWPIQSFALQCRVDANSLRIDEVTVASPFSFTVSERRVSGVTEVTIAAVPAFGSVVIGDATSQPAVLASLGLTVIDALPARRRRGGDDTEAPTTAAPVTAAPTAAPTDVDPYGTSAESTRATTVDPYGESTTRAVSTTPGPTSAGPTVAATSAAPTLAPTNRPTTTSPTDAPTGAPTAAVAPVPPRGISCEFVEIVTINGSVPSAQLPVVRDCPSCY